MGASSEGPSTTATQDEKLSSRVFNSDTVFCSKAEAFLYAVFHRRDPLIPATFSVEMAVTSLADRSLAVRSRRS